MRGLTVIHQPDFLPYLGFFHRLIKAKTFVVLDNVQFVRGTKEAWHYRDKIKTLQGEQWINVGIKKCALGTLINQVELQESDEWRVRMKNLIIQNYSKASYFKEIMPHMEEIIFHPSKLMWDFNWHSIQKLMSMFEIENEILWASQLDVRGKSNELVVNILKAIGATSYLSGVGAKAYYEPEPFLKNGIDVVWQDFKHPNYDQLHGEFIPYLTSMDLFFNCGLKESQKVLRCL